MKGKLIADINKEIGRVIKSDPVLSAYVLDFVDISLSSELKFKLESSIYKQIEENHSKLVAFIQECYRKDKNGFLQELCNGCFSHERSIVLALGLVQAFQEEQNILYSTVMHKSINTDLMQKLSSSNILFKVVANQLRREKHPIFK